MDPSFAVALPPSPLRPVRPHRHPLQEQYLTADPAVVEGKSPASYDLRWAQDASYAGTNSASYGSSLKKQHVDGGKAIASQRGPGPTRSTLHP